MTWRSISMVIIVSGQMLVAFYVSAFINIQTHTLRGDLCSDPWWGYPLCFLPFLPVMFLGKRTARQRTIIVLFSLMALNVVYGMSSTSSIKCRFPDTFWKPPAKNQQS